MKYLFAVVVVVVVVVVDVVVEKNILESLIMILSNPFENVSLSILRVVRRILS